MATSRPTPQLPSGQEKKTVPVISLPFTWKKEKFLETAQKTFVHVNWLELSNVASHIYEQDEKSKFLAFPAFLGGGSKKD